LREFKTFDIVKRLGVLTPERIYLRNYPLKSPKALFNPALVVENDRAILFARLVVGYYKYISGIAKIEIPLDDILTSAVNDMLYPADLAIYPDTRCDMWGSEDPRLTKIDNLYVMVYTGRTVNYFRSHPVTLRTMPIVAVSRDLRTWRKVAYIAPPKEHENDLVSDKDAFLFKDSKDNLYLFHRPHTIDGNFHMSITKVDIDFTSHECKRIEVWDVNDVIKPQPFEEKLGWGTPPVEIGKNKYLALVHAVGKDDSFYRVFPIIIEDSDGIKVREATSYYIFEPKETYEIFGDRTGTIFPCGLSRIGKSELLIAYGAADTFVGFGLVDLSDLPLE
jgi:predicted GH43/DUF377 family glycosyl hydrolase